ncbi:Alpha/Beta hydrolase protein [Chlamydoabsidia padenii]|nr:Alpha/Beta hydrolase protein [Chlamydoabsidia padenii]
MQNIHVKRRQNNRKPTPQPAKCRLKFQYTSSPDGVDTNLLVLLHGLGDTLQPFASLGQKLELPQTATIAVQAPEPIPFLDGECFQWFPSFNPLTGEELLSGHPEQRKGLLTTRKLLEELIHHVMDHCQYEASHIFLFGFSQGGTVALDQLLEGNIRNLGGAISISGYPLRMNEVSASKQRIPYDGPILITQGDKDPVIGSKNQAEKMCNQVKESCSSKANIEHLFFAGKGHSMPVSQSEWRSIHSFFANQMPRRNLQLENMSDVYEVQTGTN